MRILLLFFVSLASLLGGPALPVTRYTADGPTKAEIATITGLPGNDVDSWKAGLADMPVSLANDGLEPQTLLADGSKASFVSRVGSPSLASSKAVVGTQLPSISFQTLPSRENIAVSAHTPALPVINPASEAVRC